jgi:hypothetical protein
VEKIDNAFALSDISWYFSLEGVVFSKRQLQQSGSTGPDNVIQGAHYRSIIYIKMAYFHPSLCPLRAWLLVKMIKRKTTDVIFF